MIKAGKSLENPLLDKDDWYDLLTCSIVRQAVEEFRYYLKRLAKTNSFSVIQHLKVELIEIVKFFNSQWYETISPINRDILCNEIKQELKKYLIKHKEHEKFLMENIMEEL